MSSPSPASPPAPVASLSRRVTGYDVGPVRVAPATVLAPMEGITDRAFRMLVRSLGGCGLTVTEFVSSEMLARDVTRAWQTAEIDPTEHPVSIQIYGRDPGRMAEAARLCESLGADLVDLNLGCPSKQVTSGCAGSALMREPERARTIFEAVAAAISVPFTVKMRLGWDRDSLNAPLLARLAEDAGAKQVVVHGRTRMDAYGGTADWRAVAEVKRAVSVPVVVNGDILTVAHAVQALEQSGADGVMVGRGIMRNPWLLAQIAQHLEGRLVFEPALSERRAVLMRYIDLLDEGVGGEPRALLGRIKQVTGYLTRGVERSTEARDAVFRARDVDEARGRLHELFDRLEREADAGVFERVAYETHDPRLRPGDSRSLNRPAAAV